MVMVKCNHCGHEWNYSGHKKTIQCVECHRRIKTPFYFEQAQAMEWVHFPSLYMKVLNRLNIPFEERAQNVLVTMAKAGMRVANRLDSPMDDPENVDKFVKLFDNIQWNLIKQDDTRENLSSYLQMKKVYEHNGEYNNGT